MPRYLVIAVLLPVLLLADCVPASAPPTVKVGLVAPFSGRDAALGYNMLVAAKLALKGWNDRGGVGGYYVELVAQDDENEAEMGATQARKMVLDPEVVGVAGHPSEESALVAAPIYRDARLPAVLAGPALRQEDAGGPPVFQLGPAQAELAQEVARFATAHGARRLAVVLEAPPTGQPGPATPGASRGTTIIDAAKGAGIEVPSGAVMAVTPGGEDALAGRLKDLQADLVYYDGSYVEGAALLSAMRSRGVTATFLGGPGLAYPDFLKLAGPAAEGAFYVSTGPTPAGLDSARAFVDAYRAAAGTDPWPQSLQVYDAMNAMLDSLDRAVRSGQKPGREAVQHGLSGAQHQGAGGAISFDGQGQETGARGYIYHIEGMAWPGVGLAGG